MLQCCSLIISPLTTECGQSDANNNLRKARAFQIDGSLVSLVSIGLFIEIISTMFTELTRYLLVSFQLLRLRDQKVLTSKLAQVKSLDEFVKRIVKNVKKFSGISCQVSSI